MSNLAVVHRLPAIRAATVRALGLADYRRVALTPLVIGGLLAAGLIVAPRARMFHLYGFIAVGAATVFLRWPAMGLVALLLACMVVPLQFSTGTNTQLNVALLTVPALLGLYLLRGQGLRDLWFFRTRPALPLLLFSFVTVLAFVAGLQPHLAFADTAPLQTQVAGLAIFLLSAVAFFLVSVELRSMRWMETLVWIFLGLGAVCVLARLAPGWGSAILPLYKNGSLLWVWIAALGIGQAVFNRKLPIILRIALGALVSAALYLNVGGTRAWTSGWLPALVAVVFVLWAGVPRLASPLLMLGGLAAMFNTSLLVAPVLQDNEYSQMTRLEAWRIIGEIVQVSPFLGLGPGNYFWYTPLFPILGHAVRFNSHNNYVDIVAQSGLLGLICFLWFAWQVGRLAWSLRSRVQPGFAQAYVFGAIGGLAGTLSAGMLADWILPFVYNIGVAGFRVSALAWIFLGGLVALERLTHRQDMRHPTVSPTDASASH